MFKVSFTHLNHILPRYDTIEVTDEDLRHIRLHRGQIPQLIEELKDAEKRRLKPSERQFGETHGMSML